MRWNKTLQYRTYLTVEDRDYQILAEKSDDDDCCAVSINHEYVTDTDEIPTREQLETMIEEQRELNDAIDEGTYIPRIS